MDFRPKFFDHIRIGLLHNLCLGDVVVKELGLFTLDKLLRAVVMNIIYSKITAEQVAVN